MYIEFHNIIIWDLLAAGELGLLGYLEPKNSYNRGRTHLERNITEICFKTCKLKETPFWFKHILLHSYLPTWIGQKLLCLYKSRSRKWGVLRLLHEYLNQYPITFKIEKLYYGLAGAGRFYVIAIEICTMLLRTTLAKQQKTNTWQLQ